MHYHKKTIMRVVVMACLACFVSLQATQAEQKQAQPKALFVPQVYTLDQSWHNQNYDFRNDQRSPTRLNAVNTNAGIQTATYNDIPEKSRLKYTWDVLDGEVDIMGIENLRADWSNRGLKYHADMGDVEGLQFQSELGKDSSVQLRYKSAIEW